MSVSFQVTVYVYLFMFDFWLITLPGTVLRTRVWTGRSYWDLLLKFLLTCTTSLIQETVFKVVVELIVNSIGTGSVGHMRGAQGLLLSSWPGIIFNSDQMTIWDAEIKFRPARGKASKCSTLCTAQRLLFSQFKICEFLISHHYLGLFV